jgi:hypothetical protein
MSNKLHFKIDRDFTVVPNVILKDRRLSWKAKGIFIQILSLPEGWEFSISGLASLAKEGTKATKAGVDELVKAGYLEWIKGRTATNQFSVEVNVTLPEPLAVSPHGKTATGQKATWRNADNKELTDKELSVNKELISSTENDDLAITAEQWASGVQYDASTADTWELDSSGNAQWVNC